MNQNHYYTLFVLFILLSCSNHHLTQEQKPDARAKSVLEEMINDSDTPGVQYIILNSKKVLFEYYGGLAKLDNKTDLSVETTFNAFSVTKTFTALAILQLEEEGKLDIDDFAQEYLDYLPYQTNFTIRQLLNHTSGLPNPIPLEWIHLIEENDDFEYDKFVREVLDENNELDNQPGEKYSYSNIGYLILGEIISKTSGENYTIYIEKNIIDRLDLHDPEYLGFTIPDTLNHARGYIKKWSFLNFGLNFVFDKSKYIGETYEGWSQFKYFYVNGYPYGGLIGNAKGFSKYLQALIGSDIIISDKAKTKLFQNQRTNDGEILEMCLGWFQGRLGKEKYYAHPGGGGGYYCEIRIYPEAGMASIIMFNKTGVSDDRILDEVDQYFLGKDET
jgi:D-alanyl-D-alanine carboxypeptidase